MLDNDTFRIPADKPFGIELKHSTILGIPIVTSSSLTSRLQVGDAIEYLSGIILEPGAWEDSRRQLLNGLAEQVSCCRVLRVVRRETTVQMEHMEVKTKIEVDL